MAKAGKLRYHYRMKKPLFSIVIPFYKQKDHAVQVVEKYLTALKNNNLYGEIIAVINGPDDGTYSLLKKRFKDNNDIKIISLSPLGGWGRAVQEGMRQARGEFICYTNSARTNIEDLVRILTLAKQNPNSLIKATRMVRESFLRKLGSLIYNLENRLLFNTAVWDVNGTPKVIPRSLLSLIMPKSLDDLIDAEIIARAKLKHVPVLEVPVYLTERIGGKSTTNIKSALHMYRGLFLLKQKLLYEK